MRTEIRRIQKELNITSVYVTHDTDRSHDPVRQDRGHEQGVIEQIGTPVEMYLFSEQPVCRELYREGKFYFCCSPKAARTQPDGNCSW
jgi:ABC-type sugar transport system ATPase subunit